MANMDLVYRFIGKDVNVSQHMDAFATCAEKIAAALRECSDEIRALGEQGKSDAA